MNFAVIILLGVEDQQMNTAGRDCTSLDDALGHVRDFYVTNGFDRKQVISIFPDRTVAELRASGL